MIDTIWVILAIILLTALLIGIIVFIDPNVASVKKQRRNERKEDENHSEKKVIPEIDEPGKIIVSDSTYEILIEDKMKQR